MIILLIALLVALLLLCDLFLYRRYVKRLANRTLRILYIVQAVVLDVVLLLTLSIISVALDDSYAMFTMIWIVFFFAMNLFTKLTLSIFTGVQWLLRLAFRSARLTFIPVAGLVCTLIIVVSMTYGATIGRNDLRVERIDIYSNELPAAFDGFRIAQFSDTHIGNLGSRSDLIADLVERINIENPDIVVQSGDLVNIHADELNEWYTTQFSAIKAPVYAVLGNHDLGYYVSDTILTPPLENVAQLVASQRAMGWTVLENENRWIYHGSDSIAIAGVTFPNNIHHNGSNSIAGGSNLVAAMRGIPDSIFSILISHTPSLFDSIPQVAKPNLTLSGHVHAMQLKLHLASHSWSPASWLYPLYSGLYQDRGQLLYINDGIGFVLYPIRIGTKPELTIFTLRKQH